jgi:hypothetical protein
MLTNIERSSWYKDEENLVIRWVSNDSIPPQECMDWLYENNFVGRGWYVKSNSVREIEQDKFLEEYCERMANHVPSDEDVFEMRSAFGDGNIVVNVITGKRTQL